MWRARHWRLLAFDNIISMQETMKPEFRLFFFWDTENQTDGWKRLTVESCYFVSISVSKGRMSGNPKKGMKSLQRAYLQSRSSLHLFQSKSSHVESLHLPFNASLQCVSLSISRSSQVSPLQWISSISSSTSYHHHLMRKENANVLFARIKSPFLQWSCSSWAPVWSKAESFVQIIESLDLVGKEGERNKASTLAWKNHLRDRSTSWKACLKRKPHHERIAESPFASPLWKGWIGNCFSPLKALLVHVSRKKKSVLSTRSLLNEIALWKRHKKKISLSAKLEVMHIGTGASPRKSQAWKRKKKCRHSKRLFFVYVWHPSSDSLLKTLQSSSLFGRECFSSFSTLLSSLHLISLIVYGRNKHWKRYRFCYPVGVITEMYMSTLCSGSSCRCFNSFRERAMMYDEVVQWIALEAAQFWTVYIMSIMGNCYILDTAQKWKNCNYLWKCNVLISCHWKLVQKLFGWRNRERKTNQLESACMHGKLTMM